MATLLTPEMVHLLRDRALCFVTTLMPDGSPQLTETWVDTDGESILINTVVTHQKTRNVRRDPRVAVAVADPVDPRRYFAIRGTVTDLVLEGAAAHIDELSQRYLGHPYPNFGGGSGERIQLVIEAQRIVHPLR